MTSQGPSPTADSAVPVGEAHRRPPRIAGGWPLLGHTAAFTRDAFGLLGRARREQGDVAAFRVGNREMVLLSGPRAHEAFFRAPDAQLSQREPYQMMVPVFGKDVVYDAPPERMIEQLHFLIPALQDRRMRTYASVIAGEVRDAIATWGNEGLVDIYPFMKQLTRYTSSHCLLGSEFRFELTEEFSRLYRDLEGGVTALAYLAPRLPIPAFRARDRARRRLEELVGEIAAKRRRTGERHEDFLQTLMESHYRDGSALSDGEVTGVLLAALFAGHDTSSSATAWTVIELARHPEQYALGRGEVDRLSPSDGADASRLEGFEATENVIKEVLRLHPPLMMLLRSAVEPFDFDGYRFESGTWLIVSPTLAHRNPELFADPERFDPDRFAPGREEDKQPFAFIPFGGGRHRCLGSSFAMLQLKMIVAALVREYHFELTDDPVADDFGALIVGPKQPLRLRYRRRVAGPERLSA